MSSPSGCTAALLPSPGGLYDSTGRALEEFTFATHRCHVEGPMDDRDWVTANVPEIAVTDGFQDDIHHSFFDFWIKAKAEYGDVVMAAECAWPVETHFLSTAVRMSRKERKWEGPYPLHEISSFMEAAGMDPMAVYERLPEEEPKHHPLGDARQSMRLLLTALRKLGILPETK